MGKSHGNSDSSTARYQRRRLAWIAASPVHHTPQEWEALKARYGYRCVCCGALEDRICMHCGSRTEFHPWGPGLEPYVESGDIKLFRDHIIPLSRGGHDAIDNIQPLCYRCNTRKGTRTVDYRSQFAEA